MTTEPNPAPTETSLRARMAGPRGDYAAALAQSFAGPDTGRLERITDAVLAVRDQRMEHLTATVARVRAECDRIEAAVRANPQDPDFDGAYLAAIGHVRNALAQPRGECRRCHCPAGAPDCTHCNCCDVPDPQEQS